MASEYSLPGNMEHSPDVSGVRHVFVLRSSCVPMYSALVCRQMCALEEADHSVPCVTLCLLPCVTLCLLPCVTLCLCLSVSGICPGGGRPPGPAAGLLRLPPDDLSRPQRPGPAQ